MKAFESLKSPKFNTLEKNQMAKLFGGLVAPDECTGAGSMQRLGPNGYYTWSFSGDCLNQGGQEGSNTYYAYGSTLDQAGCPPA